MTNRQPKGTPVGGQFSEDRRPEGNELSEPSLASWRPVLRNGTRVVDWVPSELTEDQLMVQVWFRGDEDEDDVSDAVMGGLSPREIANTMFQMGDEAVTPRDFYDFFADDDYVKIAFRPDADLQTMIQKINELGDSDRRFNFSPHDVDRYRQIINDEFATPDGSPVTYLPNEKGAELLSRSSLETMEEHSTDEGTYWRAKLKVEDFVLNVRNDGLSGPNSYVFMGIPAASQTDMLTSLNAEVLNGFPGLERSDGGKDTEALDVLCTLIQVIEENS